MSRQLYQWLHLWAVIALVLLTTISQKPPFAKAAPQGRRRKVSRAEALRQAQEHASREQEKINARIAKKKEDGKTQELKNLQEQVNMMNDLKRERENSRNDPHEQAGVPEPEL